MRLFSGACRSLRDPGLIAEMQAVSMAGASPSALKTALVRPGPDAPSATEPFAEDEASAQAHAGCAAYAVNTPAIASSEEEATRLTARVIVAVAPPPPPPPPPQSSRIDGVQPPGIMLARARPPPPPPLPSRKDNVQPSGSSSTALQQPGRTPPPAPPPMLPGKHAAGPVAAQRADVATANAAAKRPSVPPPPPRAKGPPQPHPPPGQRANGVAPPTAVETSIAANASQLDGGAESQSRANQDEDMRDVGAARLADASTSMLP